VVCLSKIFVYPIKALPGVEMDSVSITEGGALQYDRRWALVNDKGRLINGKNNKRIFLLRPHFDLAANTVNFADQQEGVLSFELSDVDGLSRYFSAQLGMPVSLQEDTRQGFPDDVSASGPTIVSQASLEAVADWYPQLSLGDIRARFRINLELSPAVAFWEDQLFQSQQPAKTIRIGSVVIQSSNPCARCSVPTKHPETGAAYDGFYETFIKMRQQTRPSWADEACFDHWYRLSANTRVSNTEMGKVLALNDAVSIN